MATRCTIQTMSIDPQKAIEKGKKPLDPNVHLVHGWGAHGMKADTLREMLEHADEYLAQLDALDEAFKADKAARDKRAADAKRELEKAQLKAEYQKGNALLEKLLAEREAHKAKLASMGVETD